VGVGEMVGVGVRVGVKVDVGVGEEVSVNVWVYVGVGVNVGVEGMVAEGMDGSVSTGGRVVGGRPVTAVCRLPGKLQAVRSTKRRAMSR
jgi:hypothetical protein